MSSPSSNLVHLNVGGVLHTTTVLTLTRYPDSMLGAMFNGNIPSERDANGCIFIDRDGKLFRYILNFLRCSKLNLPDDFKEFAQLHTEADFYQIQPLIEEIKKQMSISVKKPFTESGAFIEVQERYDYGNFDVVSFLDARPYSNDVTAGSVPMFFNKPIPLYEGVEDEYGQGIASIAVFARSSHCRSCPPLDQLSFFCARDDVDEQYAIDHFRFTSYATPGSSKSIFDAGLECAFVSTSRAEFGIRLESFGWKKMEHISVPIVVDKTTVGVHLIEKWFLPN